MDFVAEPSNKAAAYGLCEDFDRMYNNVYRHGTSPIVCSTEKLISFWLGLLFPEFNPFYEEFNQNIEHMMSAGLPDYWTREIFNSRGRKRKAAEDVGPQVLTLEHLEDAFMVSFVPLIGSFISFICELFIPLVGKKLKSRIFNMT